MSLTTEPTPSSREDDALARHREELRGRFPMPVPKPRKPIKATGLVILSLMLGAGLAWVDPAYRQEPYSTAFGEHRTFDLADGSRITLDSDTRLTVAWHLRTRRVELENGQALFDVAKTRLRPFQVNVQATHVNVLGTLFSVTTDSDAVRVTLVRGAVSVSNTHTQEQARLAPGEQIDISHDRLQTTVAVDAEAVVAWKDSQLVFERTPLAEALTHIQRYRKAAIQLDDPSLANLPISGVFDNRNIEDLLSLLPSILPLSLNTDADGTLHVRRKPGKK